DGTYTLAAVAADLAGNTTKQQVQFQIDKTPPAAPTVTYPTDGSTLHQRIIDIQGTSDPGATVFLDMGRKETSALTDADGKFTFTQVQLQQGDNTFSVHARDRAGNMGPDTTVHVKMIIAELNGKVLPSRGVLVWLPTKRGEHHACDRHEPHAKPKGDGEHGAVHHGTSRDHDHPGDSDDTPPPSALEQLIAATLGDADIDYLIVHREDDFVRALRTQRYGTMLLVEVQPSRRPDCASSGNHRDDRGCGERHAGGDELSRMHMKEATRLEIRAMVASGTGLLWVKNQPDEDEHWDDLFGARAHGVLSRLDEVDLADGPASTAGNWSVAGSGSAVGVRLRATTGTTSGQLVGVDDHEDGHEHQDHDEGDKDDTNPAVVINAYGQGHTAWFAFNPADLADAPAGQQVVLDSVRYAVPADNGPQAGGVSEIDWTASHLNPPMDLRFTEDLSDGLTYLYTWDGNVDTALEAVWERNVDSGSTVFRSLVRLPTAKGDYLVRGKLYELQAGFPFDLTDKDMTLTVSADRDDLGVTLMTTLTTMQVSRRDQHRLEEVIEHVQRAIARPQTDLDDINDSIRDLLKAMDQIRGMQADTIKVQEELGALLRVYQADWSGRQGQSRGSNTR
ncbi:MAG: Ig-like domain-containing protein, partial [Gammaproteobacteria bacterium]